MTASAQLQQTNAAPAVWMTIQVFGHNTDSLQEIRQLAQHAVTEHKGSITTENLHWLACFASADDSLDAAIALQRATDLFNFTTCTHSNNTPLTNGTRPPILLGMHIALAENNSPAADIPPAALLRPAEIHLSESAYRTIQQDQPTKFRPVDLITSTAYKAIWKMQEFELASPTQHQGAPSAGFFVKVILICLIPFLLVLAYTWREPLQHGLSSLDGTRTIDHQLQ